MAEPELFAHYRIERKDDGKIFELGRGAMGVTYKAFDTKLHCTVALKVINATILNNEVVRQRFLREARSAAQLRHRNVASVFHLGEEGDNYFYAMEFVAGETLESYVQRQGPVEPVAAIEITSQVASALSALQRQNLVHRDIKPANLMLVDDDDDELLVKLVDFGLAKSLETNSSVALTAGGFVGTPYFASPEQLEDRPIDTRSDIYSLGATLWFLLTGKPVFSGSLPQVMSQHMNRPPPLDQLYAFPEPLRALLGRMLAKDPADRQQTPRDLRRELETCKQEAFAGATTVGTTAIPRSVLGGGSDLGGTSVSGTPSEYEQAPGPGVLLARRYRIAEMISEGLAGKLYRADDLHAGREVALRVLAPELMQSQAAATALEREVEKIQGARHPNIVQLHSLERLPNASILVAEWIVGFAILDLLRLRGALNVSEVLTLLEPVASAVDHARIHQFASFALGLRHILIQAPHGSPRQSATATALGLRPLQEWHGFGVKINPLVLNAPVQHGDMTFAGDLQAQTMVADPAFLNRDDSKAGEDADDAPSYFHQLGMFVYELLGGAPVQGRKPGVLACLSERGNAVLQQSFAPDADRHFPSARAFFEELRDVAGGRPGAGHQRGSPSVSVAPQETMGRGLSTTGGRRSASASLAPAAAPAHHDQDLMETQITPPARVPDADSAGESDGRGKSSTAWFIVGGLAIVLAVVGVGAVLWARRQAADTHEPVAHVAPSLAPAPSAPALAADANPEQRLARALAVGQDYENAGEWANAIGTYVKAAHDFPTYDEPKLRLDHLMEVFEVPPSIVDDQMFKQLRGPIAEAAQAGSRSAMMMLGARLLKSEPSESLKWYQMAASGDHGRRNAMTQVGKMYEAGVGIKSPDYRQAATWYEKAAHEGDSNAMLYLAQLYISGQVPAPDRGKAADLLQRAANMQNADAKYVLGTLYSQQDSGVPVSFERAIKLFEESSRAGNLDAAAALGLMYINGQGTGRNVQYGLKLIREAADKGGSLAMYLTAVCYEKGIGSADGAPDAGSAKTWYIKAAQAGSEAAANWCLKNNVKYH